MCVYYRCVHMWDLKYTANSTGRLKLLKEALHESPTPLVYFTGGGEDV